MAEITQERFSTAANEWLDLTTEISGISGELSKMRARASTLREEVVEYMKNRNIGSVSMRDGSVVLSLGERKNKVKPTAEVAIEKMGNYLGNRETAEALWNHVYKESCEVKTVPSLSCKNRVQ